MLWVATAAILYLYNSGDFSEGFLISVTSKSQKFLPTKRLPHDVIYMSGIAESRNLKHENIISEQFSSFSRHLYKINT